MPDANGNEARGDVMVTEDGFIFVVYRAHRLNSPHTGVMVTDGDLSVEGFGDLCVDGRYATNDDVRSNRDRIEAILSAERDRLSACYSDAKSRGDDDEAEAYAHDLDSLDDAARIIIGRFGH